MDEYIDLITRKTKILFEYYGYVVPETAIFVLSDLYKIRFDYKRRFIDCPMEIAAFKLLFFINHFVSENGAKFCEELYEMKIVKNYPFLIIFRKVNYNGFTYIMGIRRNDKKIICLNEVNEIHLYEFENLKELLCKFKIEWWVVMPPRVKTDIDMITKQAIYKSSKYIYERLANKIPNSSEDDIFIKRYAECLIDFARYTQNEGLYKLAELYRSGLREVNLMRNVGVTQEMKIMCDLCNYLEGNSDDII